MPSLRLDPDLANVTVARAFVADALAGHRVDVQAALVMVSELVTNVVKHTRAEVTLTVRTDPRVRIEVHDGTAATDAFREVIRNPPPPQTTEESGRGLSIVHGLAARVGLDDDPAGGKVVWFEL